VIRNKKIILTFLFLAWTIIFAHSIIPHHHHTNIIHDECHHCYTHLEKVTSIYECDHDCSDYACHFHVDVLTKLNIDNDFIVSSDNNYSNYIFEMNLERNPFSDGFFPDQIPKTNYLRGPPIIA